MSQPTIYEGDVHIKSSAAPSIFGAGSLEVDNNLLVSGTESSHQVDNFYTSANIIGVNEPPLVGRDLGLLATRHPTDIVAGDPTESDTSTAASVNTITLAAGANATNGYYNNWLITITSGLGIGVTNAIISYDGSTKIATVTTNWTTPPTASGYDLFGNRRVGLIWSESNQEMQMLGTTNLHTSLIVPTVNELLDLSVGKIIQGLAEECIYYVGGHGVDTNTGFHIIEAMKTFGAAITAASAETPSAVNQIVIVCFDSCIYTENLTIPSWVHIRAQSAELAGTIVVADQSSVHFGSQTVSAGTIGVISSGTVSVTIDKMTMDGHGDGVRNTGAGSRLTFYSDIVSIDAGIAVTNDSTGSITVTIGSINTLISSIAISEIAGGSINGTVGQILGTGIAFNVIGVVNINASNVNTTLAYNISATGVLNLYTGNLTGTQVISLGGVANVLPAGLLTTKGDLYTRSDDRIVRLASGINGSVLTSDAGETEGLKWAVPAGAGGLVQSQWVEVTEDLVTSADTWPSGSTQVTATATLPQATINVNGTTAHAAGPTIIGSPGFPTSGKIIIQTADEGAQIITYTGTTAVSFTGCTGGIGDMIVGSYIHAGPIDTTVAAASNGDTLPQTTINVADTTGFPTAGRLLIDTSVGTEVVLYTGGGGGGTTFTGCTLGTGDLSTGFSVTNLTITAQDFMEIIMTTTGGAIFINSTANASTDHHKTGYFQLVMDGYIRRGASTQGSNGIPSGSAVIGLKIEDVVAGAHIVSVRWVVEGGNFNLLPVTAAAHNNASLLVQEVSS
jgi:hypothetical protein